MKHTQGAWNERNGLIESVNLKRTLASVNSFGIPETEAEANAKLIEAAPKLLEALQLLYRRCYDSLPDRYAVRHAEEILDQLDAL